MNVLIDFQLEAFTTSILVNVSNVSERNNKLFLFISKQKS